MNSLEKAMTDATNVEIDSYLEGVSTVQFRKDVKEMIAKAQTSTEAGVLKREMQKLLDNT
jgi:hypothetical protein